MDNGSIYIIKNKINDKVYIGQTLLSVDERYKQHTKPSNSKKHYKIYKAMNKYGVENFYYEILEDKIPKSRINEREVYWIEKYDSFKNGYNSNAGGEGRSIYKKQDVEYIMNELKKGKQVIELAEELNVSKETINRTLKRYGIPNARSIQDTKIAIGKSQIKIDRDYVKKLHKEGYSAKEISEIIRCDSKTIRRIKKEIGLDLERPRYDYSSIRNEDIINDRLLGVKVKDILKKYNISYAYYYPIWKEYKESQNTNSNDYPVME